MYPNWYVDSTQSQQNPGKLFCRYRPTDYKFMWKDKRPRISNIILKKSKVGGLILSMFEIYYNQKGWCWWKKDIDQLSRIETPEIDSHKYNELIFDKGAKAVQWRKGSLFNKLC